jgi:DNA invertase Pin-like site-specific DNA recombinase
MSPYLSRYPASHIAIARTIARSGSGEGMQCRCSLANPDALCKAAARREFNMIMAWSVDRLGRSLQDLVTFLSEIHALKIDLYLHQQGLDTTTPAGKALFQMMGVFAEFERAMIAERVRAGMVRARANGTRSGKPIGRPRIKSETEQAIRVLLRGGKGICSTAAAVGVGVATVQRIKCELGRA